MPISNNRIILTDVDGVLLEWENHFTEWMLQRSYFDNEVGEGYVGKKVYPYKLLDNKQNTYEMAERFGLSKTAIRKEIREFNKSAWMGTQQPMPDSQTWVKLLAAEGWTFIPITSQTSDIPAQLLRKKRLGELFGEPAVLFKEKLNFKLPGGNGFTAHQDAPAFASFGQDFHITAMVSVDATTRENGCLEMAAGRHKEGLLDMTEELVLSQSAIDALDWAPLETAPGDLVLFGSIIPHRSPANRSTGPRRAAYITYNGVSQGEYRDDYYTHKREVFPPEVERVAGKDYSNTGLYNIGNPIQK